MTTKTQADLCNRILLDLDVIAQGDTAAAEDMAATVDRTTTIAAELYARRVCYLPDLDEIPDHVFEPLVDYMVARFGPSYGRSAADELTLELIERRIKSATAPPGTRRLLGTDGILRQGAWRRRILNIGNFANGDF